MDGSGQSGSMQVATPTQWVAAAALLLATAVWGVSFALQKEAGDAVNQSMNAPNAMAGPMLVVGMRFSLAAALWALIFSRSRRGWTVKSFCFGGVLGVLLVVPLTMQTMSLDFTSEATAAVFTAMAVLFTPLILFAFYGQKVQRIVWVAALLAVVGVWIKEGGTHFELGVGELLGLASAVLFAWHLIVLNEIVPQDDPYRMTLAQFAVTGIGALGLSVSLLLSYGYRPTMHAMTSWPVAGNLVLLVLFPTLVSFGLMNLFQPRVRADRAALIYLLEPVFAATFAWAYRGQGVTQMALIGAALMLGANALVELWPKERKGG